MISSPSVSVSMIGSHQHKSESKCSGPSGNSDGTMAEQNQVGFSNIIVGLLGYKRSDGSLPIKGEYDLLFAFSV
jgi:hypothetical protein